MLFMVINDIQCCTTNDPIQTGDMYFNTITGEYGTVEDIIGKNLLHECICGQCEIHERLVPIRECKRLIPVDINQN